MFRTAAARAVGAYRQEFIYAEDLDLWLRLAEIGELYNLPEVLMQYRMHAKSITTPGRTNNGANGASRWRMHNIAAAALIRRRWRRGRRANTANGSPKEISVADHHVRWAWWALMAGNVSTARKHALAGLRRNPLSMESWKLACCAVRGH